ncbi:MAG TPA: IS21 family transposase [Candidatus Paceibacterota bacterium]|nr:IS21 family transposase [Candidatus Paceibacterota bacterium]
MRYVKDILRLKHQNQLSVREIAGSCGLPASTVGDYLQRAQAAGLNWPLPEGISDAELMERLLKCADSSPHSGPGKPTPDWPILHKELGRKGVTLQLLWQEYRQAHPEGYQRSQFCQLYRDWAKTLDPVLRQAHQPGQKLFVDWAGVKVPIHHADGSVTQASLFVAVMGFSNKTYVEAFPNEQLEHWIAAHCHAFAFYGGLTRAVVPDNPKTAVTHPCRYEPVLHRSYQEMARHFGTVILPARIKKPRDKAKAETGVQIVERQILALLRDQRFFSVGELNQALRPLLDRLNAQEFQKLEGTRNSWFEAQEKPVLLPLPTQPFELATWGKATVNIDYHAVVDYHGYSVPYSLVHQVLETRSTATTVEFFHQGKRVAAHVRSYESGKFTTLEEHRPKSHQRYLAWTPSRLIDWARQTGPQCAQLVEQILKDRPHPEMGFRSCLGIIRLGKGVGAERLEAACARALRWGTCSYRSVKSILENHLDRQNLEPELPLSSPVHSNVRGQAYYAQASQVEEAC